MAYLMDQVSVSDDSTPVSGTDDPGNLVPYPLPSPAPGLIPSERPDINQSLEWDKSAFLEDLTTTFYDAFSDLPGCTNTLQHDTQLSTNNRVKAKNYPVPIHLLPYFEEEVDNLLAFGIIQPSSSPHCPPVVTITASAYQQIPLTDRAKPLTAFSTQRGLMEFCRLPFGLATAHSAYIRLMRIVLADLPNVSLYFDNIFIYTSN